LFPAILSRDAKLRGNPAACLHRRNSRRRRMVPHPLIRASGSLLQPFRLKHLTLRNRIMSTAHEPNYHEDGMPKDRYRLYHVEKAKGGIALTMTAAPPVACPDSAPP